MIGTLDPSRKDVTIVGAGIAGLLLARQLDQLGYEVTLLEAGEHAGGLIRTGQTQYGIAESGPHSILVTPEVARQFDELKIPLLPVREKARFVYRKGKLRKFPLTVLEAIVAFFRAYFVLADRSYKPEEVTLEQWSLRHLGRGGLEYLLTPFVRGVYGAEPGEVLVGAAFPMLKVEWGNSLLSQLIRRWRSRPKGKERPPMMAPQYGMGQLSKALEESLKERLGGRFRLSFPVSKLPHAGNLVLCVPAYEAAKLVAREDTILAEALGRVRYAPLVSATIFVESSRVPAEAKGVGVLVPKTEGKLALGILFNSSAFPGRVADGSLTSFTMMLGGTSHPEVLKMPEVELKAQIEQELFNLLGIRGGVKEIVIHRHERAVPIYDTELVDSWEIARRTWCSKPGQLLFGNYTGQVSLRGMIEEVRALKFGL